MTFHVPNQWRIRSGHMGTDDDIGNCGAFRIPSRPGKPPMLVIASGGLDTDGKPAWEQVEALDKFSSVFKRHGGEAWEHVSVSFPDRCPTWEEMCRVKALFWDAEDTVMQLHPPQSQWVNNHSFCLHLWRSTAAEIPLPPSWMVGDRERGVLV